MINYIESEDENRSHRSDINRMRRRQRHSSTKYVKCNTEAEIKKALHIKKSWNSYTKCLHSV